MDLIEYLQSYKKGQPLMRKRGKKKPARPRKARGYGQRSSKYNSSNNESFNNNMEKLLTTILAAVTVKPTPERLMEGTTYNPLGARIGEREIFNRMYNRPDLEDQFTIDEKKGIRKAIKGEEEVEEDPEKIEQQKIFIFNTTQDFDMKMKEILDKQDDLENDFSAEVDFGGDGIEMSNMPLSTEAARDFREANLKIKEEVVAQSLKLQELLNDAEDLNDYKDLLKKHNELISKTTQGFARVDNYIAEEHSRSMSELNDELQKVGIELEQEKDDTKFQRFKVYVDNKMLKRELLETKSQSQLQSQKLTSGINRFAREKIALKKELESEQELVGELAGSLKTFVDISKEQEQSGVLGVLGRDVLAGVRQDISTEELKKQKRKTKRTQERMKEQLEEEARDYLDLSKYKDRQISKALGQEILIRKRKSFIGELKGDIDELFTRREKEKGEQEKFFKREKEDLETLLEREEEAGEQQQEQIFELEQETEKQKGAITRGLGREIVGRKKQRTKELEFSSKLIETNTGQIESMKKTNELLEKLDKAQIQKENAQAQLRGLKQYADSLNDQILASGEKGVTAQQQYFDRKIADMENNLRMEKSIGLDLNLKLAKSETNEQALRKQLIELENEVDNQAARELERTLSGLSETF